ncbi:MAG TPA: DUF937 domain-containing protein [Rhizobiaceae bacterium]|nr:DUF937 domain-containing protein [Rhizobiaceae bacterium]
MLPLNEMLAQNSEATAQIARQFGLSQAQAQEAIEALVPAFSQGLKRNAADPYGIGAFLGAMSTGQHAKYYEDAANAFSQQGIAEGNGILGHLFGSKDVSRAVAAQASQATGIGQELMKQMLPVLASMIMGGLFKQTTGQMQAGASSNPLTEIMEQMMRGGGARMPHPEAPQPGANPFDNPFGKILNDMFGGGAAQQQSQSSPADNPLGRIFEEMMGSKAGGAQQRPKTAPTPQANPSGRPRNPYDDLFGNMFETGAKTRDDYQKNMESIFDQYLSGMEKRRR